MTPRLAASVIQAGLARGIFLAASWTWCIGMFMPVILVRHFGAGSFLAFALPNLAGVTIMGLTVLRRRAAGQGVAWDPEGPHAWMSRGFSLVTVAFQAFFLAWMPGLLAAVPAAGTSSGSAPAALWLVAVLLAGVLILVPGRWFVGACALAWALSAGVFVAFASQADWGLITSIGPAPGDPTSRRDIAWVVLSSVFLRQF